MRSRVYTALLGVIVAASAVWGAMGTGGLVARGAPPPGHTLHGQTPAVVREGTAQRQAHHDPAARLTLNIGLGVHHPAQLDALITAASTVGTPQYGRSLTRAAYLAQFAPTEAEVQAVSAWATGAGLTVQRASPDHLLLTVQGTARQVEQALGLTLNDYRLSQRTFMANDRDPTVPATLDIRAISGLTTIAHAHTLLGRTQDVRPGGYVPSDFQAAYDVSSLADGSGQTIGLVLWGAPVPQSDLDAFAAQTGTPALVSGQAGANGIDWVFSNGASTDTTPKDIEEKALDVEYAHGIAPNSHLRYWLADCSSDPTTHTCQPSDTGLESAIDAAASDPSVHVVSNSWAGSEDFITQDPAFVSTVDASLQYAASVGTTFYFASGDHGLTSGCDPVGSACGSLPSYPAVNPDVVAVGGTTLSTNADGSWGAETAWSGSGGGCLNVTAPNAAGLLTSYYPRPTWQSGVGAATCAGRAEPDVAAEADPATGAYVYANGAAQLVGGTSLATPLWAGMAADLNHDLGVQGRPLMGFAAPSLYALATNPTTAVRDFHDVTSGSNGNAAGVGWDEVTGWGSPDLAHLAADWRALTRLTVTPASGTYGGTMTLQARLSAGGVALGGKAVTFSLNGAAAGTASTDPSGTATVTAALGALGVGTYPTGISARFTDDGVYGTSSASAALTVTPAALTIAATNQSMTYGGAVPALGVSYSGFVNGETASVLTALPTCSATDAGGAPVTNRTPAGTYPITCGGASAANYSIQYVAGTLTITPAPLAITASSPTMTYGGAVPSVAASYSGFVNGETASVLTTPPTCGPIGLATPPAAGTYPTTCSGATAANYTITDVPGTLTVNPAPLTVVATNQSMTYGSVVPTLTATFEGFVNGDTRSVVSGLHCTATDGGGLPVTSQTPVGTYALTCAQATAANYTIVGYVAGILSIMPALLTITANNQTMIYHGTVPAFTASASGFVNGQGSSVVSGLQCSANDSTGRPVSSATGVGAYAITCSGASATNYRLSYVAGTLTIIYAPAGGVCAGAPGHVILQPINADGSSVFKAGSTVPAKFRVCDALGVSVGTAGVVTSFRMVKMSADPTAVIDEAVTSTTPDTAFRWDATGQQWIFNLSTKGWMAGQKYSLVITLNDGTTIAFSFALK